jgi:predicted nuclease of predicted toxin-antitoxin system
LKLLIDNQLPGSLARLLEASGLEARHVRDLDLDRASDREIWRYAKTHGYTVASKDEDFLHLAKLDATGPALVWVRLRNCPKADLLAAFSSVLPSLIEALEAGQRVVEIR